jgi:thymidylate synthase
MDDLGGRAGPPEVDVTGGAPVVSRDANTLIRQVLQDVIVLGDDHIANVHGHHPGQGFRELMNCSAILADPRDRLFSSGADQSLMNPGLAVARFFFMLSGSDRLEDIAFYSNGARRFTDDGLTMPGSSYGHRIFCPEAGVNQFEAAASLMGMRPNTRRAAIAIYQPLDCGRPSNDIPCSMGMVFSPRGRRLHATVLMRANNALRLLCYNIFEFTLLMEFMAAQTGQDLGTYHHFAVSMHILESDLPAARRVIGETVRAIPMPPMPRVDGEFRARLVREELRLRQRVPFLTSAKLAGVVRELASEYQPYWADLLIALALYGFYVTHADQDLQPIIQVDDRSAEHPVARFTLGHLRFRSEASRKTGEKPCRA